VATAAVVITALTALALTWGDDYGPLPTVLIVLLSGTYVVFGFWFLRRLRQVRYLDFRIAVTGRKAAGKTIFTLLLYDYLMNGRDPRFEFTAESRSAISTYQAIRGIAADQWPARTYTGSVRHYDGTLRLDRRLVVDMEIGDSAGEHWLNLVESSGDEQDYLQWVLSAQAICHILSVEDLLENDIGARLARDVEDLKLAARLMRSVRGHGRSDRPLCPLLIVISKMDLIDDDQLPLDELMKLHPVESVSSSYFAARLAERGNGEFLSLLERKGEELEHLFGTVNFAFSSVRLVQEAGRLGEPPASDLLHWICASALREATSLLRLPLALLRSVRR
jgi:hypothetical protein